MAKKKKRELAEGDEDDDIKHPSALMQCRSFFDRLDSLFRSSGSLGWVSLQKGRVK